MVQSYFRAAAALALVALCASAGLAEDAPTQLAPLNVGEAAPIQLASLSLGDIAPAPAIVKREPFALPINKNNSYAARWQGLQPLLRIEAQILKGCRGNPEFCPPAAAKFNAIVEAAREREGRARVGEINRAINMAIRPVSDSTQYGIADFWASPLTTLASGAGDCEDYAIAKYVALREAGFAESDLRLLVVKLGDEIDDHAVAAARVDGQWLILDSRHLRLVADTEIEGMTPVASFGRDDDNRPAMAAVGAGAV